MNKQEPELYIWGKCIANRKVYDTMWYKRILERLFHKKQSERCAKNKKHEITTDAAVEPTCEKEGWTEERHCKVCGKVFVQRQRIPALGHTIVIDEAIPADCYHTGKTEGQHCGVCGKILIFQDVIEKQHQPVTIPAVEPTCTSSGRTEEVRCLVCDTILRESTEISALGHCEENIPAVPVTCEEDGKTEGKYCTVCGKILVEPMLIPAKGHEFIAEKGALPTCTEAGTTGKTYCKFCGEIFLNARTIPSLGHVPEIIQGKDASCTESGISDGFRCSVCGKMLQEQTAIPAHGHRLVKLEAVPASCEEAGKTKGEWCEMCHIVTVPQQEVAPLGHASVIDVSVPATCTESGLTEGSHCNVCGKVLQEQLTIPAHGHRLIKLEAVPASCEEAGKTEGEQCELCHVVTVSQQEVAPLGHAPVIEAAVPATCTESGLTEGSHCDVCGKVLQEQTVIPPHGHRLVKLEAVPASCEEAGKTEGEWCEMCHMVTVPQQEVAPLGHAPVIDVSVPATCTESGLTEGSYCDVCGKVLQEQLTIPAHGHRPIKLEAVLASCEEAGKTEGEWCEMCHMVTVPQREVQPLGHSVVMDAAVPATCTESGLTEGLHCNVCGKVLREQFVIEPLGHCEVVDEYIPATEFETGLTAGSHCSRCGEILQMREIIPVLESLENKKRVQMLRYYGSTWPLGRILAFGIGVPEYLKLKEKCLPEFAPTIETAIAFLEDNDAFLEEMDEEQWNKACALCKQIGVIRKEQATGMMIAQHKTMYVKEDALCDMMNMTRIEIIRALNAYTRAVNDLFLEHENALDFLYPHGYFDGEKARHFFGNTAFKRIQLCCDLERIHKERSKKQDKPVALRASLTSEASNKRTKVLDDWGHLQKYIEEQFDTQPLLGNIELDEKEYSMLLQYLSRYYHQALNSDGESSRLDKVVCVALVQIAIRCPGAAYWPEVAKAIGQKKTTQEMMRTLGLCFLNTLKKCKKATYTSGEYVASIKLHTFVTNIALSRFFDFLFAYYETDLGRNIEYANVEELYETMIGERYFTRKQYILQQTIDALRLVPEVGMQRLKTYLNWIDLAYWNQSWQPDSEDRFAKGFQQWRSKKEEFNGTWSTCSVARTRGKRMYSQPDLMLNLGDGKIYVMLPIQRLPFTCGEHIYWRINNGQGEYACELTEAITGYYTDEKKVVLPIEYLMDEIQFEFMDGAQAIRHYAIKKDCVRIFNDQGRFMPGKRIAAGTQFIFMRPEARIKTEAKGTEQMNGPWLMEMLHLSEGETVYFPDHTLAIVGNELSEGLCGIRPAQGAEIVNAEGTSFPIYARMPYILVKTTEEQFEKTRVQIGDTYHAVSSLKTQNFELNERTAEKGCLIRIPAMDRAFAICKVHVDVPNDHHLRKWEFCYWRDFQFTFMNDEGSLPYWNVPRGSVLFDDHVVVASAGLEKDRSRNEFGFELNHNSQKLSMNVVDSPYKLLVDIPALFWRIPDTQEWKIQPAGDIWHTQLPDTIEFRTKEKEIVLFVNSDGLQNDRMVCYSRKKGDDHITCDLLPLKQWLTRDRVRHVVYIQVNGTTHEFASVYCKSYLASGQLEADFDQDLLRGNFDIVGQSEYTVSLLRGDQEVLTHIPLENGRFSKQTTLENGEYTAVVYEAFNDAFGFETIYDEIGRIKTKLLNPTDLSHTSFFVRQVASYEGKENSLLLPDRYFRVKVGERIGRTPAVYTGIMSAMGGAIRDLPVRVIVPDAKKINRCSILFDDDGDYQAFLYDHAMKRIVLKEVSTLRYMERYRRYSLLDPEDVFEIIFEAK